MLNKIKLINSVIVKQIKHADTSSDVGQIGGKKILLPWYPNCKASSTIRN